MLSLRSIVALAACWTLAAAHTVIVYPGWRGNNLHTNGTVSNDDKNIKPGSLGITYENGSYGFPYGMQWMYPCGGMPTSQNRTKWPVGGGALAIQPGWFPGHSFALFYVNLGIGNEPLNMSLNMVQPFQIIGPSNTDYPGTFCLPHVSLPANYTPNVGDNATIQVIETAQHGAALYNCVDITFAANGDADVPLVTKDNCFNSTGQDDKIGFNLVFTSKSLTGAASTIVSNSYLTLLLPMFLASAAWSWLW